MFVKLRRCIFAILLMMSLPASAQLRIQSTYRGSNFRQLSVAVCDSASRERLPGASVFITNGTDTLKSVADGGGVAYFDVPFKRDSLTFISSMLGFKTRTDKAMLNQYETQRLSIGLQEDPLQINAIVVTGESVAMVMHGDTTVFNSAAFNTFKGDPLRELLKKFPGVEVNDRGIKYQGKPIDRILVNGNNMFGKEIASAMDMVLAEEVRAVEVYEKTAVKDIDDDASIAKERVMDLRTWNPVEHIGQFSVKANGGIYTNKMADGNLDWFSGATMQLGNYTLGTKPRLTVDINGGHNATGIIPATQPMNSVDASITLGKDIPGKSGWSQNLRATYGTTKTTSGSSELFFPSESLAWRERADSTAAEENNAKRNISYSGSWYYRKGKNRYSLNGNIGFSQNFIRSRSFMSSNTDGSTRMFDKTSGDTTNNGNLNLKGDISHTFAKSGRRLTASLNMTGNISRGRGARVDSNEYSISPEWSRNTIAAGVLGTSLYATWSEPLPGKSMLAFTLTAGHSYESHKDVWTDMLTGLMDINNTKDYRQNKIQGEGTLGYRYGKEGDGFSASLQAGIRDVAVLRSERLSYPPSSNINFVRPSLTGNIGYTKAANSFSLHYHENDIAPATSQLRKSINDVNPFFLTAGNPSLKLPVDRNVDIAFSKAIEKKNMNVSLQFFGTHFSNAIASKTEFFDKETTLSEYGYIAPAGSSLTTPVNVNNKYSLATSLDLATYFPKSKINLSAMVGWGLSTNPYTIGEIASNNLMNSMSVNGSLSWSPKNSEIFLSPSLSFGRQSNSGDSSYDFINPSVYISYRQRFGQIAETSINYDWTGSFTTIDAFHYSNHSLSVTAGFLFGKDRRCRFEVFGYDLLNSARSYSISTTDYSTAFRYNSHLGRSVGVSLTFVFSRR